MHPGGSSVGRYRSPDAPAPAGSSTTTILGPAEVRAGAPGSFRAARQAGPPDSSGLVGRQLGGFRIVRELGRGAMSTVYLAEQVALQRPVALKVLGGAAAPDPESLSRFVREARVVARLVHPNAVQVYEVGRDGAHRFIALEYVEGRSLAEVLAARRRLPWRAALEVVRQAALSLECAHALDIVHRDIKPANILLGRRAEVKLTDFGLAFLGGDPAITGAGEVMGTPLYMSPEQVRGGRVGPPADLYSLGATLYHMLSGSPPFDGSDPLEVMGRHVEERPRPPREAAPDLPLTVSELALRLLAKDPDDRPASAGALVGEIVAMLRAAGTDGGGAGAPGEAVLPGTVDSARLDAGLRAAAHCPRAMRELLAFEATCACLLPWPRRGFLEATMRNYRIPPERMSALLSKPVLTRWDVWDLQVLKRRARRDSAALLAIEKLRRLEAGLGGRLLGACLDLKRSAPEDR